MTQASRTRTIGDRRIGPGHPVYITAEIGLNHNGEVATALALIGVAIPNAATAGSAAPVSASQACKASPGPTKSAQCKLRSALGAAPGCAMSAKRTLVPPMSATRRGQGAEGEGAVVEVSGTASSGTERRDGGADEGTRPPGSRHDTTPRTAAAWTGRAGKRVVKPHTW